jgi:predicted adenine nucleotide alpha hydrolase (AANH) superfamily ATPase
MGRAPAARRRRQMQFAFMPKKEMTLLNVCCAPCVLPLIEPLKTSSERNEVAFFFSGPNIYPRAEYDRRLAAARQIAAIYKVKLFEGGYDHEGWLRFVKAGLPLPPESYQENGERCLVCYKYRLAETSRLAKKEGFGSFAATLSVNRFKDTKFINEYGQKLAADMGLEFVVLQQDAQEAHKHSVELSKLHGIYRQKYCGCEFSCH